MNFKIECQQKKIIMYESIYKLPDSVSNRIDRGCSKLLLAE